MCQFMCYDIQRHSFAVYQIQFKRCRLKTANLLCRSNFTKKSNMTSSTSWMKTFKIEFEI